jgi:hypothetical protein
MTAARYLPSALRERYRAAEGLDAIEVGRTAMNGKLAVCYFTMTQSGCNSG